MKKKDGRKNNGGYRYGAGRPSAYNMYLDQIFGEETDNILEGETIVTRQPNGYKQARRFRRLRYQILVDAYITLGLPFKKGYKRDWNEFKKLLLDTPNEIRREGRAAYIRSELKMVEYSKKPWLRKPKKKESLPPEDATDIIEKARKKRIWEEEERKTRENIMSVNIRRLAKQGKKINLNMNDFDDL